MHSRSVIFDNKKCRLIILRDISELIKGEQLRSVEKLSDIMVAQTSHDMRTPLNTILNMLQLICQRVNDPALYNDPKLQKWARVANNSTLLLQYLVSDTMDYF